MVARPGSGQILSVGELALVASICFGWFVLASIDAVASGWPGGALKDDGLVWLVGTELILATVAVLFLHLRGFAVRSLVPRPTVGGCIAGAVFFGVSMLVSWLVTLPFSDHGSEPIAGMVDRAQVSALAVIVLALVNGTFIGGFSPGRLV